jgi:uncharacterized protein (DUF1697 family)
VALLRGINLGARNKVAMAKLRAVVESLGHTDVATYIQSGNVVFTARGDAGRRGAGIAALATELQEAVGAGTGVPARVVVLSRAELARVVRDNPYPDESNPRAVHAVFLTGKPGPELAKVVAGAQEKAAAKGSRDTARIVGRTLFIHTPDGFGRSELAARLVAAAGGAKTGVAGTARNWATVTKLLAMCDPSGTAG